MCGYLAVGADSEALASTSTLSYHGRRSLVYVQSRRRGSLTKVVLGALDVPDGDGDSGEHVPEMSWRGCFYKH